MVSRIFQLRTLFLDLFFISVYLTWTQLEATTSQIDIVSPVVKLSVMFACRKYPVNTPARYRVGSFLPSNPHADVHPGPFTVTGPGSYPNCINTRAFFRSQIG